MLEPKLSSYNKLKDNPDFSNLLDALNVIGFSCDSVSGIFKMSCRVISAEDQLKASGFNQTEIDEAVAWHDLLLISAT